MRYLGLSRKAGLTLLVGAAGMVVARWLHFPGGAFMGALLATAGARLLRAPIDAPPTWLRTAARVVLGLTIGATVTSETVQTVGRALLPVAVMVVMMMLLGLLAARVLHRMARMPLSMALCSSAPGALSGMVALEDELGGNGAIVASMHLVRLVSVMLFVPVFVRFSFNPSQEALVPVSASVPGAVLPPEAMVMRLMLLVALGLGAGLLAVRLKVPAGDMLAGMCVAALINPTWLHLPALPSSSRLFAQWIVGASVGVTVNREVLRLCKPYLLAGVLMTAMLIVTGLALGWFLAQISSVDLVTCLVGCAPGGADTMVILAGELGADAQLVAAMHVSRMLILMVLLPVLIRTATGRRMAAVPSRS